MICYQELFSRYSTDPCFVQFGLPVSYFLFWPPGRHFDWRFLLIGHVFLRRVASRLPSVFVLWNERERPGSERLTWLKRTGSWPWERSKRQRDGRSRGIVWFICQWNWIFLSFFICFSFKNIFMERTWTFGSFFLLFPTYFLIFSLISQEKRKKEGCTCVRS